MLDVKNIVTIFAVTAAVVKVADLDLLPEILLSKENCHNGNSPALPMLKFINTIATGSNVSIQQVATKFYS